MQDKDFSQQLPGKSRPPAEVWHHEQVEALARMREQLQPSIRNINAMAEDLKKLADIENAGRAMIEHILEPALTNLFEAVVKLYDLKIQPIPEDPKPLFEDVIDLTAMAYKYFEPAE